MKKTTKPIILSALSALAFGAVGTAGTFALFTDKAETTVSVEAGVVDIETDLSDLKFYELNNDNEILLTNAAGAKINSIGGTAKIDGSTLTLEKWAPGDKVTFNITVKNKSNVATQTRLRVTHTSTTDVDLYDALAMDCVASGSISSANLFHWSALEASNNMENGQTVSVIAVTLEFPNIGNEITAREVGINNKYQGAGCTIKFTQQAVQGNANVNDIVSQLNAIVSSPTSTQVNKSLTAAIAETGTNSALLQSENIVWNVKQDKFYYDEEALGNRNDFFKVQDSIDTVQRFSVYASSAWNAASVNLKGVGFDVGDAPITISNINYDGVGEERENSIYTKSSSTNLTIDAELDTVHHSGNVGVLTIIAVAGTSYHEYGKAAFVNIAKGRIALEQNSEVQRIHVEKKANVEAFDDIIIAKDQTVELPELSRDPVEIAEQGTLVLALQNSTAEVTEQTPLDYVWLTKQGVYEQVAISDNDQTAAPEATPNVINYADNELNSQTTQTAAQQIANNIVENVEVNEQPYTVTVDPTTRELVVKDSDSQTVTVAQTVTAAVAEALQEKGLTEQQKQTAENAAKTIASLDENPGEYVARINEVGYTTISAAFEAANEMSHPTIVMLRDAEMDDEISIVTDMVFDLRNFTVESVGWAFYFESEIEVTFKNGTLTSGEDASVFGSFCPDIDWDTWEDIIRHDIDLTLDNIAITVPANADPDWYNEKNVFYITDTPNVDLTFKNSRFAYNGEGDISLLSLNNSEDCTIEFVNSPFAWSNLDLISIDALCDNSSVVFDSASIAEKDYWRISSPKAMDRDTYEYAEAGIKRTITNGKVKFELREIDQWTSVVNEKPDDYLVDSNGNIEIGSAEAFAWFAKQAATTDFAGKTVRLTADISLHNREWTAIRCGTNGHFAGTFDGQGHTIENIHALSTDYGNGIFYSIIGSVINLNVRYARFGERTEGNITGVVAGYAYGNVNFTNVHVKDSVVNGFGKLGGILGMAADPSGVTSFVNCSVENVVLHGAYNSGGIMGLCQNTASLTQTCVKDIHWRPSTDYEYVNVVNGHATCEAGAPNGCIGNEAINGIYADVWDDEDSQYYLFGGFADLYVRYGSSAHNCTHDIVDEDDEPYPVIPHGEMVINAPYTDANGWKWSEAPANN